MTPELRDKVRSTAVMWLGGATASTERLADALAPVIAEVEAAARADEREKAMAAVERLSKLAGSQIDQIPEDLSGDDDETSMIVLSAAQQAFDSAIAAIRAQKEPRA